MSPIVFLDVDGVLNISRRIAVPRPAGIRADGSLSKRPPAWHTVWAFSPSAVLSLCAIIEATSALLVLTSTWRRHDDARDQLASQGVVGPWHDDWRTDDLDGGRGAQITRWLDGHIGHPYLVIDDRINELGAHMDRVIHTAFRVGLTEAHIAQAISQLKKV